MVDRDYRLSRKYSNFDYEQNKSDTILQKEKTEERKPIQNSIALSITLFLSNFAVAFIVISG
jgi:hypothetical protein